MDGSIQTMPGQWARVSQLPLTRLGQSLQSHPGHLHTPKQMLMQNLDTVASLLLLKAGTELLSSSLLHYSDLLPLWLVSIAFQD